jgi:hypothetical protein
MASAQILPQSDQIALGTQGSPILSADCVIKVVQRLDAGLRSIKREFRLLNSGELVVIKITVFSWRPTVEFGLPH